MRSRGPGCSQTIQALLIWVDVGLFVAFFLILALGNGGWALQRVPGPVHSSSLCHFADSLSGEAVANLSSESEDATPDLTSPVVALFPLLSCPENHSFLPLCSSTPPLNRMLYLTARGLRSPPGERASLD